MISIASVSAAIIVSSNNVTISSIRTNNTNLHDAIEELYGLVSSSGDCPYGKTCTACGAGSYANQDTMECVTCVAGTYSVGTVNSCVTCPNNYTSEAGATSQSSCYITTTAGKFIEIANTSVQLDCSEGSYCPSAQVNYGETGNIVACPEGYTSDSGAIEETDCYIETTAGKYIATANDSTQTDCPIGSYCPSTKINYGSAGGNETCPSGYTSEVGATSENDCVITTTDGKYIANANDATETNCPVGSYCVSATIHYGETGNATSCPSGYTSDAGASSESQCYIQTTGGKYIATANDTTETNCPAGSYCPSTKVYYGNTGSISTCPDGYTSDVNATSQSSCYITTTSGKYIATANSTSQSTCTSGYYCPGSVKVYYGSTGGRSLCPSIYTSSASGSSSAGNCYLTTTGGYYIASAYGSQTGCPAGSYCPSTTVYYGGTGSKSTCPGSYTSSAHASSSSSCYITTTAGKYIQTARSSTQTDCPVGSYCPSATVYYGNTGSISTCPSGYTSAKNATAQSSCYITTTAGNYIATANSSTQTDCPVGSYCPSTTVYYGSTGSISTCPSGYTSAKNATAQSSCYLTTTGGKYIATANSSTQTTCPAGSYCPAATIYYGSTGNIQSCGTNKTSPAGSSSSSACVSSSYTYTKTGSNGFTGIYKCEGGTATITGCSYEGKTCDGGSNGASHTTSMCTLSTGSNDYSLSGFCNSSLPRSFVYGGGLPQTESCS